MQIKPASVLYLLLKDTANLKIGSLLLREQIFKHLSAHPGY